MSADTQNSCCTPTPPPENTGPSNGAWLGKYFITLAVLAAIWAVAYIHTQSTATWLVFSVMGLEPGSPLGGALEFFIYDVAKILLLLVALIYALAWLRASLNVEKVRDYLVNRRPLVGYALGSSFGAVTPFCSCSSIPLFLGFTMARIPVGATMAFLITSPLVNEIAVVLLWGLLGWKFAIIYVAVGLMAGMLGGWVMDTLKADRWLAPFVLEARENAPSFQAGTEPGQKLTVRQRHIFAYGEMVTIFKRVWKWVIIGVALGAGLHGFVPENWFAENLGSGQWWTVPGAVLLGIPLYSNVTGVIPVMESLLIKGLPLGTTLAFGMAAVAASIPELILLRQIMTAKLQGAFLLYIAIILTLVGWLFNFLGPYIIF